MQGLWTSYKVVVTNERGEIFHIETKVGVRGENIPVEVTLTEDKWEITRRGLSIEIERVMKVA
jgi:hypothetical protein